MTAMTDDEQREQLKSFFKRYGSPIVTGVLLALCVFFGWQWWSKKNDVTAANLTAQYQTILNQASASATPDEQTYKKLTTEINKMVSEHPDAAQTVQAQLLLAKLAFDKQDFATASKILMQAKQSKLKDDGLKAITNLHLAYIQIEEEKWDAALKTLDDIKLESFTPSVQEAKGDIFVAKKDNAAAIKAYQQAWDVLVARKQPRELLQIKLANLGVLVEDPKIDSPIITPSPSPVSESSES